MSGDKKCRKPIGQNFQNTYSGKTCNMRIVLPRFGLENFVNPCLGNDDCGDYVRHVCGNAPVIYANRVSTNKICVTLLIKIILLYKTWVLNKPKQV